MRVEADRACRKAISYQSIRVIEFGAGSMALKGMLPDGCVYTATDIVSRTSDVIPVDLNCLPLPPLEPHDVAVFSGVFEYLFDVPAVIAAVKPLVRRLAISYSVLDKQPRLIRRRANGFANDYTEVEIRNILEQAGFELLDRRDWSKQVLFHYEKRQDVAT